MRRHLLLAVGCPLLLKIQGNGKSVLGTGQNRRLAAAFGTGASPGLFHAVCVLVLWQQKPEYLRRAGTTARARKATLASVLNA